MAAMGTPAAMDTRSCPSSKAGGDVPDHGFEHLGFDGEHDGLGTAYGGGIVRGGGDRRPETRPLLGNGVGDHDVEGKLGKAPCQGERHVAAADERDAPGHADSRSMV